MSNVVANYRMKPYIDLPDMFYEEKRLETFPKSWPHNKKSSCSPVKMAAAGFYWCGNKKNDDAVRCFVCHKELDGWDTDDDPIKEHLKHNQACPFALLKKPQDDCTVEEILLLKKSSLTLLALKQVQLECAEFDAASKTYTNIMQNLV